MYLPILHITLVVFLPEMDNLIQRWGNTKGNQIVKYFTESVFKTVNVVKDKERLGYCSGLREI